MFHEALHRVKLTRRGGCMKPIVLLAQSKELSTYIKSINELNQESLLEMNKKLLKMQIEVSETLGKF